MKCSNPPQHNFMIFNAQAISIKTISIYPFYTVKSTSNKAIITTIINNQSKYLLIHVAIFLICHENGLQGVAAFHTTLYNMCDNYICIHLLHLLNI